MPSLTTTSRIVSFRRGARGCASRTATTRPRTVAVSPGARCAMLVKERLSSYRNGRWYRMSLNEEMPRREKSAALCGPTPRTWRIGSESVVSSTPVQTRQVSYLCSSAPAFLISRLRVSSRVLSASSIFIFEYSDSLRMSISHPVSFVASLMFWPRRPIARESC